MASQHFFAYSDMILGIGHFQAAPYACSRLGGPWQSACATAASVVEMAAVAELAAAAGQIAPLQGMRESPVWVFAGGRDTIVSDVVVERSHALYSLFSGNSVLETLEDAQHAFVTDGTDGCPEGGCNGCGVLAAPFLNDCGYAMAGVMLSHLYATRGALTPPTPASFNVSNLREIDQAVYFPPGLSAPQLGMNTRAFAYVPLGCQATPEHCPLHVMYHGCGSSVSDPRIGEKIIRFWGGNGWAEENDFLMLYPQAFGSNCWDWTGNQAGLPDPLHDTREGLRWRSPCWGRSLAAGRSG
jgi:hypothetical protein